MNSFRNSREFSLYRQMVFGSRAGAAHQGSAFAVPAFSTDDAAAQSAAHAVAEIDASAPAETETE
jgi:hypothetical protein